MRRTRDMLVVVGLLWLGASPGGCAAGDTGDTDGVGGSWELAHVEEDDALLSVWGTGADDVWAAGGSDGRGVILRNRNGSWVPEATDADQLLWWIYGFRDGDVYAVGERGLILHYDGSEWRRVESGTQAHLYGVWGTSSEDVWVVGGEPTGEPGSAVILRGHDGVFSPVEDIEPAVLPNALFKIYGDAAGVIAVGSAGSIVHFDGAQWSRADAPTEETIFSLWGRSYDDLYAVGGTSASEVLHYDGARWSRMFADTLGFGLTGVFTAPDQPTIAVGPNATIVELAPDGTELAPSVPPLASLPSLHGVWGDGSGTAFAVGGSLEGYPQLSSGVILQRH